MLLYESICQRFHSPPLSSATDLEVYLQQSAAWWCFVPPLEPRAFIRALADIGYAGTDFAPPEYWTLIRDHNLQISCIQGHDSIELGLNRFEQHERIQRELETAIRTAQQWQIPNIVCFSGSRYDTTDLEGLAITAEGLQRVAAIAEDAGVNLVLELLNSRVDHPGYQADRTAWGVAVCDLVDSPRVKLLFDIYHMQIMEGDLIRTIKMHHQQFGHYHTAGNPGRNEIDSTQEINYGAVLKTVADTGFSGFVGHEFIPRGDAVKALISAFKQLKT